MELKLELNDERLPRRFWEKVHVNPFNGCWRWAASLNNGGYGQISLDGRPYLAHRMAYEALHGLLDAGVVLDHRCCLRECVNPAHLEPMSSGENSRRGLAGKRNNASKTTCPKGHPYEGENLIVVQFTKPDGRLYRGRQCRACQTEAHRRYGYNRRRAAGMIEGHRGPRALKTHCPRGHAYDEANTAVYDNKRVCKTCRNERALVAYHRSRENVAPANRLKTHCPEGHPLSGDNLGISRSPSREYRRCKTCHREREARRRKQTSE